MDLLFDDFFIESLGCEFSFGPIVRISSLFRLASQSHQS